MRYFTGLVLLASASCALAGELRPVSSTWGLGRGLGGPEALPGRCQAGTDGAMVDAGQRNLSILCANEIPSFEQLTQVFDATPFHGQRVRFSGWLMAADVVDLDGVTGSGALWIRIGAPDGFMANRMPERALTGTTSWEYRDFVVDVPDGTDEIEIGIWLQGKGQIWARDLAFEIVSDTVPVNLSWEQRYNAMPQLNLE